MTDPAIATISALLSSSRLGGAVTIFVLILLFIAQFSHWQPRSAVNRWRRRFIAGGAAVFCLIFAVLITARFLIIH